MPNAITNQGITIQTYSEIVSEILDGSPATTTQSAYPGMRQIYGPTINVDPNSPDGQMVNIVAQAKLDMLEFIQQVYTSFDPDQAVGVQLDQRCAINGIQRRQGTYTYVNVNVTANGALTIQGLDTSTSPFTVSDASGNQYYLDSTFAFTGAGTQSLLFRAANIGSINPTANSLTIIVTVTLGITAVNNPSTATTIGTPQESDYSLRIRRENSVALPSTGYWQGMYDALLSSPGVTSVNVLENTSSVTDSNGIPGHSIWVVVAGGNDGLISGIIYEKRNAGCGMKGSITQYILQADGTYFPIKYDRPTPQALWIKFNVTQITGTVPPDATYIRNQILSQLSYKIQESAVASSIVTLVQQIDPNASVSSLQISKDNVTYDTLLTVPVNYQFQTSSPHIIINGTPGP